MHWGVEEHWHQTSAEIFEARLRFITLTLRAGTEESYDKVQKQFFGVYTLFLISDLVYSH